MQNSDISVRIRNVAHHFGEAGEAKHVNGKVVNGPMPHDISYVFQENALFPWNTIVENLRLGMLFQGVPT
eukprot:gene29608-33316_t